MGTLVILVLFMRRVFLLSRSSRYFSWVYLKVIGLLAVLSVKKVVFIRVAPSILWALEKILRLLKSLSLRKLRMVDLRCSQCLACTRRLSLLERVLFRIGLSTLRILA